MELSDTVKKLLFYTPGILGLMLFVVYGYGDYWNMAVVADPNEIARYNFGSEAMIAHGGDKFRSANAYAASSLVIGMLSTIGLAASLYVLFRFNSRPLLKSYCVAGLTFVVVFFVGRAW